MIRLAGVTAGQARPADVVMAYMMSSLASSPPRLAAVHTGDERQAPDGQPVGKFPRAAGPRRDGPDDGTGGYCPESLIRRQRVLAGAGSPENAHLAGMAVYAAEHGRARQAAELAGAVVEWVRGDAWHIPFPAGSFDLVSMQYPALPKAAGEAAVRTLLDTVRPGGLLLAVYHDLNDEHREHMKSHGVDPADYVDVDDLGRLLDGEFTIELHAVRPRIDPPPDNPHIADVVLRARRR